MRLSTEQLLKSIKDNQAILSRDLETIRPTMQAGFRMAAADATENLKTLLADYRKRVLGNAVGFVVTGPKAQEFATLAKTAAPSVVVVDAEKLYSVLADDVEPTLGASREFTPYQLGSLIGSLRNVAIKAGLQVDLPMLQLSNGDQAVPTREALVSFIKATIEGAMGSSLNTIFLSNELVDKALESEFSGSVLASIVLNGEAGTERVFATRIEVATDQDTQITEEFVLQTFEAAKKSRKQKQK